MGIVLDEVLVRRQEEAAGATRRVADHLAGLGRNHFDNGLDQRTRGEVLTRPALHVLGVLLQEALVDGALHIHVQADPGLAVYEPD